VPNIQDIKSQALEAGIPFRELGSRSGVVYSRVCDAFKGWVTLRDPELPALEAAVNAAIYARAKKFTRLLLGTRGAVSLVRAKSTKVAD